MHKTTKRDFRLAQKGRVTKKQALGERNAKAVEADKYFSSLSREQQEEMVNRMKSMGMKECASFYQRMMES